jgi:uncharacterized damage-inducible protein DinB
MKTVEQIAQHFRQVFFGGNWTSVNLKDTLAGISWQQATQKIDSFNTIAVLVFHINYYVAVTLKVLKGEPLNAHDKYSFLSPPIESAEDWENLLNKTFQEAEEFAGKIAELPENTLEMTFISEKYGNYYRNLHGIIEHTHYHLGQIALLKKLVSKPGV